MENKMERKMSTSTLETLMQDALKQPKLSLVDPRAWRVVFDERPGADASEAILIKEPRNVRAILTPVDVDEAVSGDASESPEALQIIWLPAESKARPDVEREMETWISDGCARANSPRYRASTRTAHAVWSSARTTVCSNSELSPDALDALVRFTVVERELSWLERSMQAMWASISADVDLTHSVSRADQKRQSHVDQMTELAARMQAANLRIHSALEQLDPALTDPSKRLFSELVLAAKLYDRADNLNEPVQFAMDHYELANTRLIDAYGADKERSRFTAGLIVEGLIVALLAAELVVMLYGIRLFL